MLSLLSAVPLGSIVSRSKEAAETANDTGAAWPMFQFDPANTGHRDESRGPKTRGQQMWRKSLSHGLGTGPVVRDGTVYTGSGRWDTETGEEVIEDTTVYAFDAETGEELWQYEAGASVGHTPIATDALYFADDDGKMYSLDWDGSVHWTQKTDTTPRQLTIDDNIYLVGSKDDGVAMALDIDGAGELWEIALPRTIAGLGVGPHLYCGGFEGAVRAIGRDSGDQQWMFETGDWITSPPTYDDGSVFVGSDDGHIYALHADDGTEEWAFDTGANVQASPAVADGTVFVGSWDNTLFAIDDEEGTELWTFTADGAILSSAAVVDGVVYVGSNDSNVYAIDTDDGTELWKFDTEFWVGSSPAVADDRVYIGSGDGHVYAIQEMEFDPDIHGFGFPNWVGETGCEVLENPCPDDRKFELGIGSVDTETVGEAIDTWSFDLSIAGTEVLTRVIYSLVVRQNISNGHCYGMVFSALEYFNNPSQLPAAADTASDVPRPTGRYESVGNSIRHYHLSHKLSSEVLWLLYFEFQFGTIDYQATFEQLTTALDEEGAAAVVLSNSENGGGHQVLAYEYEDRDEEIAVFVYDPTSPAGYYQVSPEVLTINPETGELTNQYLHYDQYAYINPELSLETVEALTSRPAELLGQFAQAVVFLLHSPASLEIDAPDDATLVHPTAENIYNGQVRDAAYVVGASPGEYTVTVVGEGEGEYTLETYGAQNGEVVVDEEISGMISGDESEQIKLELGERKTETTIERIDGDDETGSDTGVPTDTDSEGIDQTNEGEADSTDDEGAGFGVGAALSGIAGAAYFLKQRLDDSTRD